MNNLFFIPLRSFLSVLLSASLVYHGTLAQADSADDAKRATEASIEMARKVAEDLFRFYLVQALDQSLQRSQNIQGLVDSIGVMEKKVRENRAKIGGLVEDSMQGILEMESQMLTSAEMKVILNDLIKKHRDAVVEFRLLRHQRLSAIEYTHLMKDHVQKIVSKLKNACDLGVAAEFTIPNMPPLTFRPPDFEIGFSIQLDSSGLTSATPYYNSDFNGLLGPDTAGYTAAGSAIATSLIYKGLVAAGLMNPTWLAMGVAGLIVLAILVIVSLVMDVINRSKAKKAADAIEWAIQNKGNSKTVAAAFRDICAKNGAGISKIPERIQELENTADRNAAPWTKFEVERKDSKVIFDQLMTLIQDLGKKTESLKAAHPTDRPGDTQQRLMDTPEFKALQTYTTETVTLQKLSQVFEVQMMDLALGSKDTLKLLTDSKEYKNEGGYEGQERRLNRVGVQIRQLQKLSYQQSLIDQHPEALEMMAAELKNFAEQREVYVKWTELFSRYLGELFNLKAESTLASDLQDLLERVKSLRTENPKSILLKALEQRILSVLEST